MKSIDVVSLRVVKEKELLYELPEFCIKSPSHAASIFQKFIGDADRENFVIIMLDTKNQVNAVHSVSVGTLNSSLVHPREVFKTAIVHNAAGIILGHNHPSGVAEPSSEDVATTSRLVQASEILGIKILDHIIVTDSDYNSEFISFKEKGLI